MTIFVKPHRQKSALSSKPKHCSPAPLFFLSVGQFFFQRAYDIPYISLVHSKSLKHFSNIQKLSLNPLQKFHQDHQPNSRIPNFNSGFKIQSQAILHSNLHQEFSKVEVCGLIVETFLSTSPTIYPLFYFKFMGPYDHLWTLELWNYYYTSYYGLFLYIIMKWNDYMMFMVFMPPWSNYEGCYICIYICMLLVGCFTWILKFVGLSTLETHDFIYMNK